MSPKQRRVAFDKIIRIAKAHKVSIIFPQEIDAALESKHMNLNWLEAEKSVEILNVLKPEKAFLDCPSPNINAYKNYILERLEHKTNLICAHHADRDIPVVSAASVIAKTIRDDEIEKIKRKIGVDFGSGYIADERTKNFIEKNWSTYPKIFRHSWAPYKRLAKAKEQKRLGEF